MMTVEIWGLCGNYIIVWRIKHGNGCVYCIQNYIKAAWLQIVYNALVLVLLVVIAVSSFLLDLTVNLNITAVTGSTVVFIDLGEVIIWADG